MEMTSPIHVVLQMERGNDCTFREFQGATLEAVAASTVAKAQLHVNDIRPIKRDTPTKSQNLSAHYQRCFQLLRDLRFLLLPTILSYFEYLSTALLQGYIPSNSFF